MLPNASQRARESRRSSAIDKDNSSGPNAQRLVEATTIVGIDFGSGDKIAVVLSDGSRQRAVEITLDDLLGSYPRFQTAVLYAAGVYFNSRCFEGRPGRGHWKRLVTGLIRGAK